MPYSKLQTGDLVQVPAPSDIDLVHPIGKQHLSSVGRRSNDNKRNLIDKLSSDDDKRSPRLLQFKVIHYSQLTTLCSAVVEQNNITERKLRMPEDSE
jgi:hypothetical protein